jgi:hypothetical protein
VNSLNIGGRSETSKAGSGSGGFIVFFPREKINYSVNNSSEDKWAKNTNLSYHQTDAGGEQFAGTDKACCSESSTLEIIIGEDNRPRILVRVARDLAQNPVAFAGIRQHQSRSKLRLRQIRERKWNQD